MFQILMLDFEINISTEIFWLASKTSLICKFNKAHGVVTTYRKVTSSRLSWLVAHPRVFRRLIKWKFDAYVL